MYYLNAFNEMLRKRQRQNMMGGEGVGNAPPSGPMGASQSGGGMAGVRNALTNMNPAVSFGIGMLPGIGPMFNMARAANAGMSAYERSQANQNSYAADDSMDRLSFNAPAYGQAGPEYGPYVDDSGDRLGFSGPTVGGPMSQPDITGTGLAPMAPEAISSPVSQPSVTGTALDTFGALGGGFAGADYGGGLGGFGSSSNEGVGIGERGDLARGGLVTPEHLHGPNPPGEDDGYTALKRGEYVITKAAVEKYGKRLLDAINNGTFR